MNVWDVLWLLARMGLVVLLIAVFYPKRWRRGEGKIVRRTMFAVFAVCLTGFLSLSALPYWSARRMSICQLFDDDEVEHSSAQDSPDGKWRIAISWGACGMLGEDYWFEIWLKKNQSLERTELVLLTGDSPDVDFRWVDNTTLNITGFTEDWTVVARSDNNDTAFKADRDFDGIHVHFVIPKDPRKPDDIRNKEPPLITR